ncbi:hypothetical protein [Spirosoma linguale]|uniref:Uncharacterized protein n=1 Tax=Spirosoma linguale (strain ATCC 33905 / DSM 74 / LMG 10896 / Claus 1) TaxID=504472 RepID=D2QTE7_SPILD|nr:hypothetical protein Slin_6117 [Spirosoma linguale DSM 74]
MSKTASTELRYNPFYAVRVGSTIDGNTSQFFPTVIADTDASDKPVAITTLSAEKDMRTSMTGESSYVYNDQMNQGSLGVAGSYGVSGVSKVSAAVSVYAGKSSASSSSSINLNYNVQLLAGVEYIDFDRLSPETLLNALKNGPRYRALAALTKFLDVKKAIQNRNLVEALKDPAQKEEIERVLAGWHNARENFFKQDGDGLVVGVMWGGLGTVSLQIDNTSGQSNWKYGGRGNFSYAGINGSVSVEAAYDGSQQRKNTDVKVSCSSVAMGGCISQQIADWEKKFTNLGFDKLADAKLLDSAPGIDTLNTTPTAPAFVEPTKDKGIAARIEAIRDLNGLEAFAIASAYDKASKDPKNKDLTLAQFIDQTKKPADTRAVDELTSNAANNDIDVLTTSGLEAGLEEESLLPPDDISEPALTRTADDFTVLGVWIANWADLFPWLATGYLNEVSTVEAAQQILAKQCMIQDLLTLTRLYRTLASTGLKYEQLGITAPFDQIANSFSQEYSWLKDNLDKNNAVRQSYGQLGIQARAIYGFWNTYGFLRGAELGLGLMLDDKSLTTTISKQEVADDFICQTYTLESCTFVTDTKTNYSGFASFLKLLPFITPDGKVYVFGPANMLVSEVTDEGIVLSKNPAKAMAFTADTTNKLLTNGNLKLYPIPFSGAEGVREWMGQSVSTNLASSITLKKRLNNVKDQLTELSTYSFSSDNWNNDANAQAPYSIRLIKTQYVGLMEAAQSVFNGKPHP